MTSDARGRPRSSSRSALEDAAAELFLERGYHATTVDEIAARAGVSRATFFNYFSSKSAVLWVKVDDALDVLESGIHDGMSLNDGLHFVAQRFSSTSVPLIATQSEIINTAEDSDADAGQRIVRLARLVALSGSAPATVWPVTGAIVQAAVDWATAGVERRQPEFYLERSGLG
jgi:AcrR family transcriptional regulator